MKVVVLCVIVWAVGAATGFIAGDEMIWSEESSRYVALKSQLLAEREEAAIKREALVTKLVSSSLQIHMWRAQVEALVERTTQWGNLTDHAKKRAGEQILKDYESWLKEYSDELATPKS